MRIFDRFGGAKQSSVKIRDDFDEFPGVWVVAYPNQLVIAGIVVFREIDVIFPKEVVCDDRLLRMVDPDGIFQRKRVGGRLKDAGSEQQDCVLLLSARLGRRFELEKPRVLGGCLVQPALKVIRIGQGGDGGNRMWVSLCS